MLGHQRPVVVHAVHQGTVVANAHGDLLSGWTSILAQVGPYPRGHEWVFAANRICCILYTELPPMAAQLVKLESAPDLVDQVYRSLLDAISEGSLAPGERITQEDIAEKLAVSRQPVLQALRLLKKDGFVLDAPGRGVLVAPLDADWMSQGVPGARRARCAGRAAGCGAALPARPQADRGRPQGRARPQRQGHDRCRHGLSQRDLCRFRQPADRAERAPALAPPAPCDGRGAAAVSAARGGVGRTRGDRRGHRGGRRRPRRPTDRTAQPARRAKTWPSG